MRLRQFRRGVLDGKSGGNRFGATAFTHCLLHICGLYLDGGLRASAAGAHRERGFRTRSRRDGRTLE
jgi:hypothetical protein